MLFHDVDTVNIDYFGSLRDWIHKASDKKYWNQLVKRLLHPDTPLLECPEAWGTLPSWRAQRAASGRILPPTMKMAMRTVRTAATMATTMAATIGGIGVVNHKNKGSATPPHHREEHPPCTSSNRGSTRPPLLNTTRNGGSTT